MKHLPIASVFHGKVDSKLLIVHWKWNTLIIDVSYYKRFGETKD